MGDYDLYVDGELVKTDAWLWVFPIYCEKVLLGHKCEIKARS